MFSILEQQDAVSIEHRLSCFIVLVYTVNIMVHKPLHIYLMSLADPWEIYGILRAS